MKRNICRTCSTVLIPGMTSRVRNRRKQRCPFARLMKEANDVIASRVHFNVTHTACLSCDTRRTVPCPPTSLGEEGLDGKRRAARRSKQAKRAKVPFHNREATTSSGPKTLPAERGHTLWRGNDTVENWGESSTRTKDDTVSGPE